IKAYMQFSSSTVLRCYGILKEPEIGNCIIVFPLAYGVEIHKKGIIHRDFHPGNLLYYRRTIYVSDLGFTRPVTDTGKSRVGIMPYMPPEVLNRNCYSQASDVYSFGMIMWILTLGMYPFHNEKHDIERPTANEAYQEILGWLNKFDNDPQSEIESGTMELKNAPQLKPEKLEMSDDIVNTNSEEQILSNGQSTTLLSNSDINIKITISEDPISSNCDESTISHLSMTY
ncbi:982_t:CDS:2, partial [Cetraspora pellucida]